MERQKLLLFLDGKIVYRSEPLPNPSVVNEGLKHIEDYVHTVDLGQSLYPEIVKANMFEALLYLFFSPFASEYMRRKYINYGQIDPKGPRFLYIYGSTQNGKSTLIRFALQLITGQNIEALPRNEFTGKKVRGSTNFGTIFPLVFDDVEPSKKSWVQDVFKSHWESGWVDTLDIPQIVMASNEEKLQDWAKSRIKRVDFDVSFSSTEEGKRTLRELFERKDGIFTWFSHLYLECLAKNNIEFSDDELHIAREVMRELYKHAGREKPDFFLNEPVEKVYDKGRIRWSDILHRGEAKITREKERHLVRFPNQMQHWEVKRFKRHLPPQVKARQEGNTIIIETPTEFDDWCKQSKGRLGLFGRRKERSVSTG